MVADNFIDTSGSGVSLLARVFGESGARVAWHGAGAGEKATQSGAAPGFTPVCCSTRGLLGYSLPQQAIFTTRFVVSSIIKKLLVFFSLLSLLPPRITKSNRMPCGKELIRSSTASM